MGLSLQLGYQVSVESRQGMFSLSLLLNPILWLAWIKDMMVKQVAFESTSKLLGEYIYKWAIAESDWDIYYIGYWYWTSIFQQFELLNCWKILVQYH